MRGLIPYVGSERAPYLGKLVDKLGPRAAARALELFRSGLDNVQISSRMGCTPAAAANALFDAREEERRARG